MDIEQSLIKDKHLKREICFDGSNFFFRDIDVGEVEPELKFCSPIPKEIMDNNKEKILGRIIGVTQ